MIKMRHLLYTFSFGVILLTTAIGCANADAQVNQSDSLNITTGTNRDPGPDGNPVTYDQNPANLPLSDVRTYDNIDNVEVQNPTKYGAHPPGACAICKNGKYSFSKHRQGTCSRNGGVAKWLKDLP